MRISTATILILGAIPIVWVIAVTLWQLVSYPYQIQDVGIPWAVLIVEVAAGIIALGLLKWWLIDH
jgi:hypothetical protein